MIIDSHQHLMIPTELQLEKMEAAGVDKTILFCSAPHPERAQTYQALKVEMNALYRVLSGANSQEENLARMNGNLAEVIQVVSNYPDKFLAFGSLPLGLSVVETSQWIEEKILANDLKGLGEFTPGTDEQMEQLTTVFHALAQFPGLPIWVHTFAPVSSAGIQTLMKLCKTHQQTPVIFGHFGGYHWMDVLDFALATSNAYIDTSAAFSSLAIKMAVTELPERCLYGSDCPYGDPQLSLDLIEAVSPSSRVTDLVLGESICRLMDGVKRG